MYLVDSSLHSLDFTNWKCQLLSLEHTLQSLRREVVRAMRDQKLKFSWRNGDTFRPDVRELTGTENGLYLLINRICYTIVRDVGYFPVPLLPFNVKSEALDSMSYWDRGGLSIRQNEVGDFIIGSVESIASSEVSTEIEETILEKVDRAEELEDSEEDSLIDEECDSIAERQSHERTGDQCADDDNMVGVEPD